jgi:hypothetical protein
MQIHSNYIPTFFVGWYHTPCLSTDARVFLFPGSLVPQVLMGAMSNNPPIWVHGVGDISVVILSYWILYISVRDPDRDFSPLHKDYTPSSFHFLDSCLHYSLVDPLFASQHNIKTRNSHFRFLFLSSSSSRRVQSRSGEGRVNE